VREFLDVIRDMGDGELGYMLLLRHLPELLRRAIRSESLDGGGREIQIDKPMSLYFAERLGQGSSEMNLPPSSEIMQVNQPRER
ncbi:MAG: hypothetical protein J2P31_16395, partial [Blastocatellia bacterium]|nr:hypothetical protein [Blastocatellia bacterium]